MADNNQPKVNSDPIPEVMEMANEARALANNMTDVQREDSYRRGMQLIYGGDQRIAAKAGRT